MKLDEIQFDTNGLIPAVVQSNQTGKVLMVAYMNRESLRLTLETQQTHFFSRSRMALWHKGATSGNFQTVERVFADCDGDTLLVLVSEKGPACHTGKESCFDNYEPLELM